MTYFYYDNLGKKYYSKFDALNSSSDEKNIYLYYYDKEFRSIDWTKEPNESLRQLYRLRAQQLRDSYEYLILAYSGGIDSTNVLETFYYNNIHLDEIMMVGAFSQDSHQGSDENHNGEIYKNCATTLNNLNLKNTKITYHDYTKLFYNPEKLTIFDDQDHKINTVDFWYSPHHYWWKDINLTYKPISKKKTIIFGIDKPIYKFEKYKMSFQFNASSINQYGNHVNWFKNDENLTREYFYWTPDMPKIIIKQLHDIFNTYVNAVRFSNTSLDVTPYNEKIIEKIIYPDIKNPLLFKSPKSGNKFLSLRDTYLLNKKNSKIYFDYIKHIEWVKSNIKNPEIDFFSKQYYIN